MSDRSDEQRQAATPAEGVRILGADEAQAALEQRGAGEPGEPDTAEEGEELLPDRAPDEGPTWSASGGSDAPATEGSPGGTSTAGEPPSGEVPPLQHWTEPPTGAVPAIFADDEDEAADADVEAWATTTGGRPRFRAEGSDWAAADFAEDLPSEEVKLGALAETGPVDEEAEFAKDLAARRRPPRGRPPRPVAGRRPAAGRRPDTGEPEAAPPGAARARDLPTAVLTAAVVAIVALISFREGTTWTAALAAVVLGVATVEFSNALRTRGFRPATLLALVGAVTLPLAAKHYGTGAYPVFFALVTVFSMLWFLWEVTPGRPLLGVASTLLAFGYVGGLGGFVGLILASRDGVGLVLGVAICTIAYDVFGFFVGSQFGHSPVAPRISPNKTLEGTLAGMLAAVVLGVLVVAQIHPWTRGRGLELGVLVAIGAFLGDLCESMLKRDLGLKDFGSVLPGHGGVLDRFDALLFCLPITYFLALHLHLV